MSEPTPDRIGKYPVTRELGRGATSVVYLGRDPFAGREVAIKVVRSQQGPQDTDLQRRFRKVFLNEAALVGNLFHPHILAIYDAHPTEENERQVAFAKMRLRNLRTAYRHLMRAGQMEMEDLEA